MTSAAGLRERKKAATRQALHQAAVRLAAERGVDNVTIEAIADAAAVSRRTFSNYFAGKEQALLHGDENRLRRLLALVRARPAAETPWTALTRAAEQLAAEWLDDAPERMAEARLIRGHPSLRAHQVATYAAVERELAAEISARIPAGPRAPLRARLLAATFLTTLRTANQLWHEQHLRRAGLAHTPDGEQVQPEQHLVDLVRQALEVTRERFR